jgi:cyanophycin synthetase
MQRVRPSGRPESRTDFYRSIWAEAAERIGAEPLGPSGPYLEITRGPQRTRLFEGLVERDDPVTLAVAGNKPLVHRLLSAAGLVVPDHFVGDVAEPDEAVRFALAVPPVVIKPAGHTGRGQGVTGCVASASDVLRALLRATRFDPLQFLVERQLEGVEYRVLVLDGVAIAVVRRAPPHVIGDGQSSIAQLVRSENARREAVRGVRPIDLDLDAVFCLRRQGVTPATVLRAGSRVRVKTGTGECGEHEARSVHVADPELAEVVPVAVTAAQAVGSRYASVEVIVQQGGQSSATIAVLAVNTTPGLGQHYAVSNPSTAPDVAASVLEKLLSGK